MRRSFYWRWLKTAFTHSLGPVDLWTGLVVSIFGIVDHFLPQAHIMTLYGWMIPVFALAAVMLVRLILAPYWMWREDQQSRNRLDAIAAISAPLLARKQKAQTSVQGFERLIEASWALRRATVTNEADYKAWRLRYLEWFSEAADFVEEHVSHIAALHFRRLPNISVVSPFATGINNNHRMDISRLADKHDELERHLAFAKDTA